MIEYNQSAEYLRLALPLMARFKVPATPENYAIFFEYVSHNNQALTSVMDRMIASDSPITAQDCRDLYEKNICNFELENLQGARASLRGIIAAILTTLKVADDEAARYQKALQGYSKELDEDVTADKVRDIAKQLSTETDTVRAGSAQLYEKLEEKQQEVYVLQKALEEARLEATTDALTGLLNRKAFNALLQQRIATAEKEGDTFSLLMVDIDHFKRINDTHGHLVGDKVIKFVAHTLQQTVGPLADIARFGGEEFVVLFREATVDAVLVLAEKIRNTQEQSQLVAGDSRSAIGRVTLSIGGASYRAGELGDALLRRADESLYEAKKRGRNSVVYSLD